MHNCAFMHNCYSNCVYMQGYCSMCICYYINFHSHLFFFSLLHAQPTNSVFLSSFSFSSNAHKQTHPHPHTNKPTRINQQRDRSELVGFDRCLIGAHGSWPVLDRSSWVLIGAWLELVGPDRCLIGARGSWSLLDWSSSWSVLVEWLELVGLLLERSLTEKGLAWSELGRSDRDGTYWRSLLEMGRERATNQKMGRERERALVYSGSWEK